MVDPALQIEKQGADQSPNSADKEFEAKHTKYSVCAVVHTVSRGTRRRKDASARAAVAARYGRRQMIRLSKPKSYPRLFNRQSVSDSSNRTRLSFSPARTLGGWQPRQGQQMAILSRHESQCESSNRSSELPSDRSHQSQPLNSSG
jgi:hypothetical protein